MDAGGGQEGESGEDGLCQPLLVEIAAGSPGLWLCGE